MKCLVLFHLTPKLDGLLALHALPLAPNNPRVSADVPERTKTFLARFASQPPTNRLSHQVFVHRHVGIIVLVAEFFHAERAKRFVCSIICIVIVVVVVINFSVFAIIIITQNIVIIIVIILTDRSQRLAKVFAC
jgi:ABC-type transport system involved in cytochrome bd biosynthesis fused ATPase/permease subunit